MATTSGGGYRLPRHSKIQTLSSEASLLKKGVHIYANSCHKWVCRITACAHLSHVSAQHLYRYVPHRAPVRPSRVGGKNRS